MIGLRIEPCAFAVAEDDEVHGGSLKACRWGRAIAFLPAAQGAAAGEGPPPPFCAYFFHVTVKSTVRGSL
ncbi:hypothetical protein NUTIK01_17530 [Novosphingobium sp. IK01]|uniref:Uncharacterized protein n=1 Tax=Novosphingobium pituita TaxID=3056842 RepID=A0ABQ6P860_9SPHN|nr:hypothetical protein NUTIK01_17530 [Novosphingobium sp. IK01]